MYTIYMYTIYIYMKTINIYNTDEKEQYGLEHEAIKILRAPPCSFLSSFISPHLADFFPNKC